MKIIYCLPVLLLLFLTGCYEKEGDITPSEGLEEIFPLPQGNHEYDNQILKWHDKYGFYALYIFEAKDLYWANTEWLEGLNPNVSNNGTLKAKAANPDYVGQQLEVFKELFLNNYSDELIKEGMPLRVLLCSETWDTWNERVDKEGGDVELVPHYDKIWCYRGWDNIAINGANKDINSLDRDEKIQISLEWNRMFLRILGDKKLIAIPEEFYNVSKYETNKYYSGTNLFLNGYLNYYDRNAIVDKYKENDLLSFLNLMGYPREVLEAEPEDEVDSFQPSVVGLFNREGSTLCRQKYDILLKCLKDAGVDMDHIQYPVGK